MEEKELQHVQEHGLMVQPKVRAQRSVPAAAARRDVLKDGREDVLPPRLRRQQLREQRRQLVESE